MNSYLKNGENVALPPGGFEEATLTSTKIDRVFIRRRYGFVRLCLRYGVRIRPVYAFGEGKLFSNVQGLWRTRLALNRFGIPTIVSWGRPFFPLLPKKGIKMHIVVGRPLILPKIENPTIDDVTLWHEKYINELKRIYDEHKHVAYGSEEGKVSKLEVW
jgi:2-acylglycerol O-acyltransferase 2